eukprot:265561_1
MSAMNLPPPEDISHSRALGGDGNSNLFSPLTLISLAARLCSVSPTPTLPSLPSSLFRVSDRNKGQGLSINELHRAYCGDNNSHQLPKEGLFEEGSTWARLEIPDTVSAASNDIEGGLMMGPPNESMFAIFSPGPVKAEKKKEKEKDDIEEGGGMMGPPSDSMFPAYSPGPVKEEKQYQVSSNFQFEIEEKPGSMSGTLSSVSRNNQPGDHPKKRIKPMSVKPLATGPTVVPSSLPVATLDMSKRRQNVSKRKCHAWPKQIWEYPKWPLLPLDTIDMEEKRISELQQKSPDLNSSHRRPRGLATGDEKVSLLFLPADESSMQLTRELNLMSRLELHVPKRKRLRQVSALLREKWKAIPQPRLDRLRLLVPCLSQDKDRQVVVDESIQEQPPRFVSCWGESKMEWTLSDLLDELEPHDATIRVPDQNNNEGLYFIVLYILGTVGADEMGVLEVEEEVILPFSTDGMLPSQYYRIPLSNPYNLKTLDVVASAQSDPAQQQQQMPPLTPVNGALYANSSSLFSSYEASTPACDTTTKEHHTTTNQISFALGEDTCASLFSWNMQQ